MTNIYQQFAKDDEEKKNIIELAPSQNIGTSSEPDYNPYSEITKRDEESRNNIVKANLQAVMKKDPEMVGEGLRLAEEIGLDKSFALDSDEAIKLMRERNRQKRLEDLELAKYSPVLHLKLTDPTFAAIAYDNISDLQGLEKLFDDFKSIPENAAQGWEKGRLNVRRGKIGTMKLYGNTDEELDKELAEINKRLEEIEKDGTGIFEEGFSIIGQYSKTLPDALQTGLYTGAASGVAGAATGPGSIFTAKGGFIVGFLGSMAFDSYAIEGGSMYLDLLEEDLDSQTSRNIATGVGLVNAGFEFIGLGAVAQPVKKALIKETTKQLTKKLTKPTVQTTITNFAKNYFLNNMLAESLTEVAQEATNVLGRDLAVALSDTDLELKISTETGRAEIADRLTTTFIRSMQGMALVGLAGSGPIFIGDIQKVRKAKENEVFLNELSTNSSASVLKKRSATEYQDLTQDLGNDKGKPFAYVDAQAVVEVMKQQGITLQDIEQVSPNIANQIKELNKSGALVGQDIVIPTGEYAAKLAGTEFDGFLKQHIRWDKDGFSKAESTYFETNRQKLYEEARQITQKKENQTNKFTDSVGKIKNNFEKMLLDTGKFRNKDATNAATFYQSYVITQSDRLGITPDEFVEKYPYKVVGPEQTQVLEQQNLKDVKQELDKVKKQHEEHQQNIPPEVPEDERYTAGSEAEVTTNDPLAVNKKMTRTKMTDAYAKRRLWELKNLELLNKIEELESEGEIFSQRAKPQKQGKPIPDSVSQVNKLENSFDFAKSKPFPTNRQFKIELQERVKQAAKEAGIDVNDGSIETEKYLVQSVIDDANFALIENSNAVGWYNEKVTKAKRILSLIHPELATDPVANFAFTWSLANTSNMIKVDKNFELAEIAYRHYKETGKFPTDIGIGKAAQAINANFKLFNRLIREKEFVELEKFMKTQHTVKEVKAYTNDKVSGENESEIVYGAAVMGPKIGNGFFANLYGFFEQLTMDRWLIRSWGRLTGTLVLNQRKQANMKRDQLKPLLKALSPKQRKKLQDLIGVKIRMTNLDEVAVAIDNASTDTDIRETIIEIANIKDEPEVEQKIFDILGKPRKGSVRIGIGDEIRKNGISYTKFLDGQKEAPSGAPERRFIRKVFNQALDVLQQNNPDLTMADLQALLWYPEKRLYDSAKLVEAEDTKGYVDDEAPDYANASVNLAKKFGVSETDIQTTLQEVDLEIQNQSIDRARVDESGERRPDGIQQDNESYRQGRIEPESRIDEGTGLPFNEDGTVTVYHHTNKQAADSIRKSGELKSSGEPDVYVTTRNVPDTGYGDTSVGLRVDPTRLSLDDEFPNGRRDFRLSVGKPRGSIRVDVIDLAEQSKIFSQQQVPSGFDDARGGFDPKTLTAFLNTEADISTFFHETAHFMLTVMEDLVLTGQATPEIQNDFNALLDFWGVENVDAWSKLSLKEKRKYHEAFAYNYEIYLTEKKAAPNVGLQEIFIKFGDYVRKVYRSIVGDLNETYKKENGVDLPVLTDEVRAVMDRMIASEDAILQSQQIYAMKPMFETQEQSGMDDATWNEYTKAIQETQDAAIDSLTKASMGQLKWLSRKSKLIERLQNRETRETRKRVMAEETVKAENEPLYKLQKFLKTGEWNNKKNDQFKTAETSKIDIDSLKNLMPFYDMASEIKKLGTGKNGMVGKNGIPVQIVAEMFGFDTAIDMVNGLVDLEPIKTVIKERTEQRMLDEFSNLTDPEQRELQIQEALHNEARARFLAIEFKFLTKTMQPVRFQVAAARQVARDILADKKIGEIRPTEYARASKRAVKDAEKAMREGDNLKVIQAKKAELLHNQLAREAAIIQKQFIKAEKDFKKFFKDSDKKVGQKKSRTIEFVNAGQEILSRFGLGPELEAGATFVDKLKNYAPDLYKQLDPIITEAKLLPGRDISDLTYRDFNTLTEIMDSLWYQSRRDKQFKIGEKLVELQAIKDELIPLMKEQDDRLSIRAGKGKEASFIQQTILFLEGQKAKGNRVEHWAERLDGSAARPRILRGDGLLGGGVFTTKEGDVAGPFTRYIWRTLKDPITKWRSERPKYTGRYLELLKEFDFGSDKINAYEFDEPYLFGDRTGRGKVELIGALLHTGNLSNKTKLLVGRGWGSLREDGSLDSTKWDAFEKRMQDEGYLTAKDYEIIQKVFDLNQELLPLIQQSHRDVFGYYFKEVSATPIVNRFGTFEGGYVPAKPDYILNEDLNINQTLEEIKEEMRYSVPAVPRGFTKARTEVNRPLSISLFDQAKHLDDALRFAYVQPAVTDLLKLFNDKDFKSELNRIDRFAYKNMLMPWLENAATQRTSIKKEGWGVGNLIEYFTKNTSINYMFMSFKNASQQLTGALPAMLNLEKKYMTDAFKRYLRNPIETMDEVAEMSPFMADRQINQMFDIQNTLNDLIINPNKYQKIQNFTRRNGYFLQQAFQNFVDSLVWIATWNQVTANAPKTMTPQQIQVEAIAQADANVRKTQDSLLPEDVAAYQIDTPLVKAIVQFTSYFNSQANLNATRYKKTVKELGFKNSRFSGQIFYAFLFGSFLPAIVSEGIQEAFSGGLVDEDEDGYLDDILEFIFFSNARYTSAFIPTGSTFLMLPFNAFDDKPYNDRITISPSISLINSTMQGTARFFINLADPNKEVKGNEVRSVITLMGLIGQIPTYPFAKAIGLLHDYKNGRWIPRGPIDLIRGLVSGQKGEGRD
tara:strand:- start:1987 stop:10092 length:8106 start_codon:yes stop_codon:yes gene_type:complete